MEYNVHYSSVVPPIEGRHNPRLSVDKVVLKTPIYAYKVEYTLSSIPKDLSRVVRNETSWQIRSMNGGTERHKASFLTCGVQLLRVQIHIQLCSPHPGKLRTNMSSTGTPNRLAFEIPKGLWIPLV